MFCSRHTVLHLHCAEGTTPGLSTLTWGQRGTSALVPACVRWHVMSPISSATLPGCLCFWSSVCQVDLCSQHDHSTSQSWPDPWTTQGFQLFLEKQLSLSLEGPMVGGLKILSLAVIRAGKSEVCTSDQQVRNSGRSSCCLEENTFSLGNPRLFFEDLQRMR